MLMEEIGRPKGVEDIKGGRSLRSWERMESTARRGDYSLVLW